MGEFPDKLKNKLKHRKNHDALRSLGIQENLVDFSSNDYLGYSESPQIFQRTKEILNTYHLKQNGATGSRLLTGNHLLYQITEDYIAQFHNCEQALLFNSGYDANVGFFSSIPQRGDFIFYDELCHASIRDGIQMSQAKAYKFQHNDIPHLRSQMERLLKNANQAEVYIVTESVFSMDGDTPDLKALADFCNKNAYHLVVDEAHALGVFGSKGEGLMQELNIQNEVFARIVTFGKGLGAHGAAILGSRLLYQFLINFSRSFIYTTALPPHSVATILSGYHELATDDINQKKLKRNIAILQDNVKEFNIDKHFTFSKSAIQSCIVSGNDRVKKISTQLKEHGFDSKPILSPTVPEKKERLRICLHSFNTEQEITLFVKTLSELILST